MSTHEVKVIRITEINPHPNADTLELVPIWGYTCAVRKGAYKVGDLAAYVEPDYEVPLDRPEFAFLTKPGKTRAKHRIAVMRLRGVYSEGLLVKVPEGAIEGDNVIEALGITRYEPPEEIMIKGAFAEKGPEFFVPHYDLENYKKYHHLMKPREKVIYTAKIHGTNARYVWTQDRMWCGSRTQWKMKPGTTMNYGGDDLEARNNAWWLALEQNPWIETWCKANPGVVLYGEVYGPGVQSGFSYGKDKGQFGFAVFDILENKEWTPNLTFSSKKYEGLQFVPVLYKGKHDPMLLAELSEKDETFNKAGHVREGIVIKLQTERFDPEIKRIALKYVGKRYLEGK